MNSHDHASLSLIDEGPGRAKSPSMKTLIVFAHPEPASFNGALKDTAVATLQQLGHEVTVSDLYQLGWNPALGPGDFAGERANADYRTRSMNHALAITAVAG
jgi:NAD(P)H dehydrogenase (quinone)